MKIKFRVILLVCVFAPLLVCNSSKKDNKPEPGWPEINSETKPWTRWWWHGSNVDKENLSILLQEYSKAGLGGLEITPIYGVKGQEKNFVQFTSPKWMDLLSYTLSESKRLNLGIDMALASGWPFGGPWVTPEDACKYLELKEIKLPSDGKLKEKIEFIEKPLVRAVSKSVPVENLKDPIAKNDSLYIYAFDQVRFPRKLPLVALMAYGPNDEILDLTELVDENGNLNHAFPDTNWKIIAAFSAWHGKQVERAGPGGEGDVIDHFSKSAIKDYLNHFDTCFQNVDISGLRAFFNDSYEVDDARGEANWTPTFFDEFKERRGYDLKKYLPELMGLKSDEDQQRILCDYRETISDLLLDNFTAPWQKWARDKGKIIRNQAHGSPANILDLYSSSDIPETEGADLINIKFASSAAHTNGKRLVSAEAATWLNEHFLANLADTKERVDLYFTGGVNHIVYHGTPYSPIDADWPGRMFYAAVHFAPSNPLWNDFPTLNNYVTRVQSFLQSGATDNDILVYYPIYDAWMNTEKKGLPHFHGVNQDSETYQLAKKLIEKGYSFDFVSDKQLNELNTNNQNLIVTKNKKEYKTILVPKTEYIPLTTFKNIIALAEKGAKITFISQLPGKVPGWGDFHKKTSELETLKEGLRPISDKSGLAEYKVGNGSIFIGVDVDRLLNKTEVVREYLGDFNLQFIRLNDDGIKTYFISNWSGKDIETWCPFSSAAKTVIMYNPMTGEFGKIAVKTSENGEKLVHLKLKHGQSFILRFRSQEININEYKTYEIAGNPVELDKNWKLEFISGGPVLPESVTGTKPGSWTQIEGEAYKNFSGSAIYTIEFNAPQLNCDAWLIDLGKVHETAKVILNNNVLATLIGPDYSTTIDSKYLKKENRLKIIVSNLMANRIIYMDKNDISYRNFYNVNFAAKYKENQGPDRKFTAKNWEPLPSGLIESVMLYPLKRN